MFSDAMLDSSGKHLICDIKDIQNKSLLHSMEGVKSLFDSICQKYDYQVLNKIEHVFEPQGFSIIYLLSESHMSIHTFPERNYAAIDLYTCRNYDDNLVYTEIYIMLIEAFAAKFEPPVIVERRF
jgi:S-adenosylmethionine decarboxylase proenzyme